MFLGKITVFRNVFRVFRQFEEFIDWKGLKKEFKEFTPKSIIRNIQRNEENLAETNPRPKIIKVKSKEHDKAI